MLSGNQVRIGHILQGALISAFDTQFGKPFSHSLCPFHTPHTVSAKHVDQYRIFFVNLQTDNMDGCPRPGNRNFHTGNQFNPHFTGCPFRFRHTSHFIVICQSQYLNTIVTGPDRPGQEHHLKHVNASADQYST